MIKLRPFFDALAPGVASLRKNSQVLGRTQISELRRIDDNRSGGRPLLLGIRTENQESSLPALEVIGQRRMELVQPVVDLLQQQPVKELLQARFDRLRSFGESLFLSGKAKQENR